MSKSESATIGFILCLVTAAVWSGCRHSDGNSRQSYTYGPPPLVYVDGGSPIRDGYIYYPAYQVYYSPSRRHFVYRDGRTWAVHSTPPRSVATLLASPSVRLDFHEAPELYHAQVVKQYPVNWKPPARHEIQDGVRQEMD